MMLAARTILGPALHALAAYCGITFTFAANPETAAALATVRRIRREIKTLTEYGEMVDILTAARAVANIPGDMAEVGVYRGGTAAVMLAANEKPLHLFDTFAGLPESDGNLNAGDFAAGIEAVTANLRSYSDRIYFYPGLFPDETAHLCAASRFSLVHLDMDLYTGTLAALRWFWPRMSAGAILICHDYWSIEAVRRACDEFFADAQAAFMPLSSNQCVAVKVDSHQ